MAWCLFGTEECGGPFMMELKGADLKWTNSELVVVWYDDAAHLFTPHSFLFERVGPRERRVLWDPFGAVQCELGITAPWPLTHSLC
jgi:hypothetical protein